MPGSLLISAQAHTHTLTHKWQSACQQQQQTCVKCITSLKKCFLMISISYGVSFSIFPTPLYIVKHDFFAKDFNAKKKTPKQKRRRFKTKLKHLLTLSEQNVCVKPWKRWPSNSLALSVIAISSSLIIWPSSSSSSSIVA